MKSKKADRYVEEEYDEVKCDGPEYDEESPDLSSSKPGDNRY